jgi:hypothetical protein
MNYWDIKLYDDAVKMALQQLKHHNYESKILETFPSSFRTGMMSELETPIEQLRRKLTTIPKWLNMNN